MKPPHCLTWKCHKSNQLLSLWIALLRVTPEKYHQDWIAAYQTSTSSKNITFLYLKHKALCHSCNFGAIKCFVCLSSNLVQWSKQVRSLSTIFIEASLEPYTIHITFQLVCITLVENPPFCNYIFNYCLITNIVENYKNSCNFFLQLGNVFLNCKLAKLMSTSRKCHYSQKCMPCVNTTTIATMCHYLPI
jgi:hypothetical protein